MAVSKLSQIATTATPPASADYLVGVTASNVDHIYTISQIGTVPGDTSSFRLGGSTTYQSPPVAAPPYNNIAIGSGALSSGTVTGTQNIAIGIDAGIAITAGQKNIIIGDSITPVLDSENNVILHVSGSLGSYNGSDAVIIGNRCAPNFNGNETIIIGSVVGPNMTSGDGNTLICADSGANHLDGGNNNTIIGSGAGNLITSGSSNTCIGQFAGSFGGSATITGTGNTLLMSGSGAGLTSGNNNFAVGNFDFSGNPTASDCVVFANVFDYNFTTAGEITLAAPISILEVHGAANPLFHTNNAITSGAGAQTGTLTNSPVSGNPTKWIPIDDIGTIRYIPAW